MNNTKTQQTWRLRTTDNIGKLPRPTEDIAMWVCADCLTADIYGDTGDGLNFRLSYTEENGWMLENWIEPLDSLPEFPEEVYEELYTSFEGELEITI